MTIGFGVEDDKNIPSDRWILLLLKLIKLDFEKLWILCWVLNKEVYLSEKMLLKKVKRRKQNMRPI